MLSPTYSPRQRTGPKTKLGETSQAKDPSTDIMVSDDQLSRPEIAASLKSLSEVADEMETLLSSNSLDDQSPSFNQTLNSLFDKISEQLETSQPISPILLPPISKILSLLSTTLIFLDDTLSPTSVTLQLLEAIATSLTDISSPSSAVLRAFEDFHRALIFILTDSGQELQAESIGAILHSFAVSAKFISFDVCNALTEFILSLFQDPDDSQHGLELTPDIPSMPSEPRQSPHNPPPSLQPGDLNLLFLTISHTSSPQYFGALLSSLIPFPQFIPTCLSLIAHNQCISCQIASEQEQLGLPPIDTTSHHCSPAQSSSNILQNLPKLVPDETPFFSLPLSDSEFNIFAANLLSFFTNFSHNPTPSNILSGHNFDSLLIHTFRFLLHTARSSHTQRKIAEVIIRLGEVFCDSLRTTLDGILPRLSPPSFESISNDTTPRPQALPSNILHTPPHNRTGASFQHPEHHSSPTDPSESGQPVLGRSGSSRWSLEGISCGVSPSLYRVVPACDMTEALTPSRRQKVSSLQTVSPSHSPSPPTVDSLPLWMSLNSAVLSLLAEFSSLPAFEHPATAHSVLILASMLISLPTQITLTADDPKVTETPLRSSIASQSPFDTSSASSLFSQLLPLFHLSFRLVPSYSTAAPTSTLIEFVYPAITSLLSNVTLTPTLQLTTPTTVHLLFFSQPVPEPNFRLLRRFHTALLSLFRFCLVRPFGVAPSFAQIELILNSFQFSSLISAEIEKEQEHEERNKQRKNSSSIVSHSLSSALTRIQTLISNTNQDTQGPQPLPRHPPKTSPSTPITPRTDTKRDQRRDEKQSPSELLTSRTTRSTVTRFTTTRKEGDDEATPSTETLMRHRQVPQIANIVEFGCIFGDSAEGGGWAGGFFVEITPRDML
ncbi:hypothetical protein BLNAU_14208 [Blattamonas nauphoetae]|uniref:Uncharacterized protein n=1 Tax=Blattamonas nauphoetae TaxID=2049346 RepID=A0ABQ9XKX4_9EUKA|nr:hypothetical protein BLNAU_14208 [Blattamonas nauphoetae]